MDVTHNVRLQENLEIVEQVKQIRSSVEYWTLGNDVINVDIGKPMIFLNRFVYTDLHKYMHKHAFILGWYILKIVFLPLEHIQYLS